MSELSHLNPRGEASMVDVSAKAVTHRVARARGFVTMRPETLAHALRGDAKKGDVFGTARLAGIQAAKRTWELIPLCHPLGLSGIEVAVEPDGEDAVRIEAEARIHARTGVEMEALVAVSTAALTVYDMLKAIDRGMRIGPIGLIAKSGGRSGAFQAELER